MLTSSVRVHVCADVRLGRDYFEEFLFEYLSDVLSTPQHAQCYLTLFQGVLHPSALRCAVLCCAVLCCAVLYCGVL